MELFRYSSNAWGQKALEGVSWDLLPIFFGAALAVIILHACVKQFLTRKMHREKDA